MPRIAAPNVVEHRRLRSEAILDATAELLRTGESVTIASIAAAARLPRTTVYEYFPNAEEAVEAARVRRDAPLRLLTERALAHPGEVSCEDVDATLQEMGARESRVLAHFVHAVIEAAGSSPADSDLGVDMTNEVIANIAQVGLEASIRQSKKENQ